MFPAAEVDRGNAWIQGRQDALRPGLFPSEDEITSIVSKDSFLENGGCNYEPDARARRLMHRGGSSEESLPSEEGRTQTVLTTFTWKPGPESGLDCLVCAIFARQRPSSG